MTRQDNYTKLEEVAGDILHSCCLIAVLSVCSKCTKWKLTHNNLAVVSFQSRLPQLSYCLLWDTACTWLGYHRSTALQLVILPHDSSLDELSQCLLSLFADRLLHSAEELAAWSTLSIYNVTRIIELAIVGIMDRGKEWPKCNIVCSL